MVILTERENIARGRLCLPLDVDSYRKAVGLVSELKEYVGWVKVGLELFVNSAYEGINVVNLINHENVNTFLDLKYLDIKNTVRGVSKAASRFGVGMFNVHASGGSEMMRGALEGAREGSQLYRTKMPKIVAVTVLTSIDERTLNQELRVTGSVADQVIHYAKLAQHVGLDGVVCSAAEMYALKKEQELRPDFMYVTPGIQAIGGVVGADQKRVFSPGNAIRDGSTILVAGRTITKVNDKDTGKEREATPDEMRANAYAILQDMAKNL